MTETEHIKKKDTRDFTKLKPVTFLETRLWHERNKDGVLTGRTIAVMWDGNLRHVGIAVCASDDQFSRKRGRQIAVGRARAQADGRLAHRGQRALRFTFRLTASVSGNHLGAFAPAFGLRYFPENLYLPRGREPYPSSLVDVGGGGE